MQLAWPCSVPRGRSRARCVELRRGHDDRILHVVAYVLREGRKRLAEVARQIGKLALRETDEKACLSPCLLREA